MELDYQVKPSLLRRWKPALQNWRLFAFIGAICVPFIWVGYTFYVETMLSGIHQHGQYTYVDLKSLGNFPFDKESGTLNDVPKVFRALDGKPVELVGKMWSRSNSYEAGEFEFVYDIAKCCFNGPPRVQERVFVHVPGGKVYLRNEQVRVTGTLHVRAKRDQDGVIISLYDLDLDKDVEPI